MPRPGRDKEIVLEEHAAPSHIRETHNVGTEKHKKEENDPKTIKNKDQTRK